MNKPPTVSEIKFKSCFSHNWKLGLNPCTKPETLFSLNIRGRKIISNSKRLYCLCYKARQLILCIFIRESKWIGKKFKSQVLNTGMA